MENETKKEEFTSGEKFFVILTTILVIILAAAMIMYLVVLNEPRPVPAKIVRVQTNNTINGDSSNSAIAKNPERHVVPAEKDVFVYGAQSLDI